MGGAGAGQFHGIADDAVGAAPIVFVHPQTVFPHRLDGSGRIVEPAVDQLIDGGKFFCRRHQVFRLARQHKSVVFHGLGAVPPGRHFALQRLQCALAVLQRLFNRFRILLDRRQFDAGIAVQFVPHVCIHAHAGVGDAAVGAVSHHDHRRQIPPGVMFRLRIDKMLKRFRGSEKIVGAKNMAGAVIGRTAGHHDPGTVGRLPVENVGADIAGDVEFVFRTIEHFPDDKVIDAAFGQNLRHLQGVARFVDVPGHAGVIVEIIQQPVFAEIDIADQPFAAEQQLAGSKVETTAFKNAVFQQFLHLGEPFRMAQEKFLQHEHVFFGKVEIRQIVEDADGLGDGLAVEIGAHFRRVRPGEIGVGMGNDEHLQIGELVRFAARLRDGERTFSFGRGNLQLRGQVGAGALDVGFGFEHQPGRLAGRNGRHGELCGAAVLVGRHF